MIFCPNNKSTSPKKDLHLFKINHLLLAGKGGNSVLYELYDLMVGKGGKNTTKTNHDCINLYSSCSTLQFLHLLFNHQKEEHTKYIYSKLLIATTLLNLLLDFDLITYLEEGTGVEIILNDLEGTTGTCCTEADKHTKPMLTLLLAKVV